MAAALFSNIAQTQARSVSIEVLPATRNLAESQLVHAALKKYGEVVFFRNKRYKNSTSKRPGLITATFDTPQAAQAAIASGTLQIPLHSSSPYPSSSPSKSLSQYHSNTATDPDPDTDTNPNPETNAPSNPSIALPPSFSPLQTPQEPPSLQIRIQESTFDHNALIQRNPFYHPFEPDTSSVMHADIMEKLGLDPGMKGLADAPSTQKKEKLVLAPREKARRTMSLIQLRERYGSLCGLWEEGKRAARGQGKGEGKRGEAEEEEEINESYVVEGETDATTSELQLLETRMWKTMSQIKLHKRKGLPCPELEEEVEQLAKHRMALESMNDKAAENKKEKKRSGLWGRKSGGDDAM